MLTFTLFLFWFSALLDYRASAQPAVLSRALQLPEPSVASRAIAPHVAALQGPKLSVALNPSLGAESTLSAAEQRVGMSVASTLDSFMRDPVQIPGEPDRFNHNLDLVLVLDNSGSIGESAFSDAKESLTVITNYVNNRCQISPTGSRVALIEFSSLSQTHVLFHLGYHNSIGAVNSAIYNTAFDGGLTATAKALRLARTEIQQNGNNNNAKVVWVLTDGHSNTGGSPIPEANLLKQMGVTVCAAPIGNNVNMVEINAISSPNCVFEATSFARHRKILDFAFAQRFGGAQPPPVKSPRVDSSFFGGIRL